MIVGRFCVVGVSEFGLYYFELFDVLGIFMCSNIPFFPNAPLFPTMFSAYDL